MAFLLQSNRCPSPSLHLPARRQERRVESCREAKRRDTRESRSARPRTSRRVIKSVASERMKPSAAPGRRSIKCPAAVRRAGREKASRPRRLRPRRAVAREARRRLVVPPRRDQLRPRKPPGRARVELDDSPLTPNTENNLILQMRAARPLHLTYQGAKVCEKL